VIGPSFWRISGRDCVFCFLGCIGGVGGLVSSILERVERKELQDAIPWK
jgi:hypothetical protein